MTTELRDRTTEQRDALAGRLFAAVLGTLDVYNVYLGDRLGLYRALDELGGATSSRLARATDTNERYVREWLEQQTATGLLEVDDVGGEPATRRYRLPEGHREVLLDRDSLSYLAPLARLMVAVGRPLPKLLEVFRTGGGIPYADYGDDAREGIAELNRPTFLNLLGSDWLPRIPDLHARLQSDPPARVLDVGCGAGWSTIALARAYPKATVEGLDLDEASIAQARANAVAAGLDGRVSFSTRDAGRPGLGGPFDLITAFETIHDMSQPVAVLAALRRLLAEGGSVVIADERVGDQLGAPADEVERLNYGFSVLACLPSAMGEPGSAATGTVMRAETLRRYAAEAGFDGFEVLPIEHDFWRFYRLTSATAGHGSDGGRLEDEAW